MPQVASAANYQTTLVLDAPTSSRIAGATVLHQGRRPGGWSPAVARTTNAAGWVTVHRGTIPFGRPNRLTLSAPGHVTEVVTFSFHAGPPTTLTVRLRRVAAAGIVRGRVTATGSGHAIPGATVRLLRRVGMTYAPVSGAAAR